MAVVGADPPPRGPDMVKIRDPHSGAVEVRLVRQSECRLVEPGDAWKLGPRDTGIKAGT